LENHDFMPKNHIFSNFRGGAPGAPPSPPPKIGKNMIITGYDVYLLSALESFN
jgi:hypothetical protein